MLVLNACRRAYGAGYQPGSSTGCLKGTRESVLNEIERWTDDFDRYPIFWLNGLAGTGKTTIAKTIAERVFTDGRLGASFFCSRYFDDRRNLKFIFPTLAFQLSLKYPDFRASLIPLLQSNPNIVYGSLSDQMQHLLVEPLQSADVLTVIVIDALDECRDEDPESSILLVLGRWVSEIPGVKFFITSRPEMHITNGFRGPLLEDTTDVFVLHGVERRTVDHDIRRFFEHKLFVFPPRPRDWPTDEQLDLLCQRAAGFFQFAVATVNFLKRRLLRPWDQLDIIVRSPESTAHEGKGGVEVHAGLDSLYRSVVRAAFVGIYAEDSAVVRSVLSALILVTNPLSPSAIATLIGIDCDKVWCVLHSIQSLLALPENSNYPVQPFHKSFADFITDPARCVDSQVCIPPDHHHIELVLQCLELMEESLERNVCSIPDYILNSEVEDLPKRIEGSGIHGALEYACRSWHKHLLATKIWTPEVVLPALRHFLEQKFLFWLEVLSVLGAANDAICALNATIKWLNEVRPDRYFDS